MVMGIFPAEWLEGSPNLSAQSPELLWIYLVFMNGLWVVVPLVLLWDSAARITQVCWHVYMCKCMGRVCVCRHLCMCMYAIAMCLHTYLYMACVMCMDHVYYVSMSVLISYALVHLCMCIYMDCIDIYFT
ncbi:hypothetical protein EON63_19865, partial [archaeon]